MACLSAPERTIGGMLPACESPEGQGLPLEEPTVLTLGHTMSAAAGHADDAGARALRTLAMAPTVVALS